MKKTDLGAKAQGVKVQAQNGKTAKEKALADVPVWNLSLLYPAIDSPELLKDKAEAVSLLAEICEAKDDLKDFSISEILHFVRMYARLMRTTRKLFDYATLSLCVNRKDKTLIAFEKEITHLIKGIYLKLTWVHNGLFAISDELKLEILMSSKFKPYAEWLGGMLCNPPELSMAQTKALLTASNLANGWSGLYNELISNFEFKIGKTSYGFEEILDLCYNEKEDVAKKAQKALDEVLSKNIYVFATALNQLYEGEKQTTDLQFTDEEGDLNVSISAMELDGLANGLLCDQIESMLMAVSTEGYELSQKFYSLLARIKGKEKLSYYERTYNPIEVEKRIIPWQDCKNTILATLAEFHNIAQDEFDDEELAPMAHIAYAIFEAGLIHAKPMPGKDSGAFCSNGLISFIKANYRGTFNDLLTIAHEIGHAIHHHLVRSFAGSLNCGVSISLSEIASLFCEKLIVERLLADSTLSNSQKLHMLIEYEMHHIASIQRQCAFHMFERRIFKERRNGDVSPERMTEIYCQEMTKYLGFPLETEAQHGWATVSHFFGTPFYVRYYTFAGLVVNKLWSVYKSGRVENFAEEYVDFLRFTATEGVESLLSPFDLDIDDENFWEDALSPSAQNIKEIERLAKLEGLI